MKRIFSIIFLCASSLQAIQIPDSSTLPPHLKIEPPWFTGPLLAPSGVTVPPGHFNLEPYIYAIAEIGTYDRHWHRVKTKMFWSNSFQPQLQIGFTEWLDFQMSPTLYYNYTNKAAKWGIGDMPIGFDIQLFKRIRDLNQWSMGLKLELKEMIPIGKYQNLQEKKEGTDAGGEGSWQTAVQLVWGNLFYLGNNHFVTWRTSLQYNLPAPVHVKNLNAYGGARGTRGTVYPAQNIQVDTAIEFNFNRNWAFAMDFLGSWSGKTRFKGKTSASNQSPSGAQFSLAPALEYNFNAQMGLIFGSWFTIAGRNEPQFASGILAFNYFH